MPPYVGLSLPSFLIQAAASFLPRDGLVTLALTSRGCSIISSQELHHRRRVRPAPLCGVAYTVASTLPQPIARLLHRLVIHLGDSVCRDVTPLHRRPSIPGMELGGEVAERVDIEWGTHFPLRAAPVHWMWKSAFGDGEDERPCAFLGIGLLNELDPSGGGHAFGDASAAFGGGASPGAPPPPPPLFCLVVTCAQRMTTTGGGITYVTVALLLDHDGYVVDLTWSFVMGASTVFALRSLSSENELIFSSHPTVFGHLHRLRPGYNVSVAAATPTGSAAVPLAALERFHIPLPPRSNRSSFQLLLALFRGATTDVASFSAVLSDEFIIPISRSVSAIRSDLFAIKVVTRDLTTPKGIWSIETADAEVALVDVATLWHRRAEKQLSMAARRFDAMGGVLRGGVIPLGTLLCMNIDHSDPLCSPSQVYLA